MTETIEIVPEGMKTRTRAARFASAGSKHIEYRVGTIPLPQQHKSKAVDVSSYAELDLVLSVSVLENAKGFQPGLPSAARLHVTLEHAPTDEGPWVVLHAFEPVRSRGEQLAQVATFDHFVRASWYWDRADDAPIVDRVTCAFGIVAEGTRKAEPVIDKSLQRLSAKELEAKVTAARAELSELDTKATCAAAECRETDEKFKAAPTPQLASELACRQQLAANARADHRARFEEAWPLEQEVDRRASLKRLAELRQAMDCRLAEEAIAEKLIAILGVFGEHVHEQLQVLDQAIAARTALLDEVNALERSVGDGREHRPIDVDRALRRICDRAAERLPYDHRGRPTTVFSAELRAWVRTIARAAPTVQAPETRPA